VGYPGERPVIDGQNSRATGISIRGNYITVGNLRVTNHTGHDIDVDRSSFVVLDNLEIYITGRALHIQESNNITVKNSTITTPTNIARQTDGIYSQRNRNNIYENNQIVIYNQDPNGHDDAIQLYQDESAIVRNNYLAQVNSKSGNAQGLYATTMYGISRFYNNVVNLGNAQSNALSFRKLDGTGTVEIVGNTVYGQRPYHGIWVTETDNPIVKNNLVRLLTGPALTLSGSGSGVSNNITNVDPKFVSVANLDFHLQSSSPAINTGASLGSPYNTDKDGKSRPQGSAWDIGAYEYGGSVGPSSAPTTFPGTVSPTRTRTPTPRPVSPTVTPIANRKPGDANGDGWVNSLDLLTLVLHFFQSTGNGANDGDFNNDGSVNVFDLEILATNYGK
jgi:hypothetical protein